MRTKRISISTAVVLILLATTGADSHAQGLTSLDFRIDGLALNACYDSVAIRLGPPDSIVSQTDEWSGFTAYYFPRMVIWVNDNDLKIWTLDIYDPSLPTHRGISIGDPDSLIDVRYATKPIHIYRDEFTRVGPYDSTFHHYDEHRVYWENVGESESFLLVLFSKNRTLTKILLYVGFHE